MVHVEDPQACAVFARPAQADHAAAVPQVAHVLDSVPIEDPSLFGDLPVQESPPTWLSRTPWPSTPAPRSGRR